MLRHKLAIWTAWLAVLGLSLALVLAGFSPYIRQFSTTCIPGSCAYFQLSQGSALGLKQAGSSIDFFARYLTGVTLGTVLIIDSMAVFLFWKKWDNRMALFLSFMLLTLTTTFFFPLTEALVKAQPSWRLPVNLMTGFGVWSWIAFGFLFPGGRLAQSWARWYLWISAVFILGIFSNSSLTAILLPDTPISQFFFGIFLLLLFGSVFYQIHRYRNGLDVIEKQQVKWVVFGFSMFVLNALIYPTAGLIFPKLSQPGLYNALYYLVGGTLNTLFLLVLLACIAISILRYRLWDIDLVIRRTLVYGALTATLALVYFITVVVLQEIFQLFTGQHGSPIATVISTLGIAALFTPLRQRIQADIDRRFYRNKYNAEQALARFALTARNEVDLNHLTQALVDVLGQTMQPEQVTLWLAKNKSRDASN